MTSGTKSNEAIVRVFMEWASDKGYAVAVFTPEEIGEGSIDETEERMIEAGWYAIESMR